MQQIMYDIRAFGPVTATIRVYDPLNSKQLLQNLYLYDGTYIYGHPWPSDPKEYDGYHAIGIMGFGVEVIKGEEVPYWIIRNSWGTGWGKDGFGKVRRGKNLQSSKVTYGLPNIERIKKRSFSRNGRQGCCNFES